LVAIPNASVGNLRRPPSAEALGIATEFQGMIGKLIGAWLGEKAAGKNEGAKGALLGYGTAALAKRSVPTLAALALGGWAFKKWREKRRSKAEFPSDASPDRSS
jgi:hypothetical protein